MRLKNAHIQNFRSINSLTLEFTPTCRILVGINESGKSNVLRALALLSPERVPTDEDRRDPLQDEPPVSLAYVRFVFQLDNSDRDKILKNVQGKTFAKNFDVPILVKGSQELTPSNYCKTLTEGLYHIDVIKKQKTARYWSVGDYSVVEGWKKPTTACPPTFQIPSVDGVQIPLSQYRLVRIADYVGPEIPESYLEPLSADDVTKLFGTEITELVRENLPKCTLWEYNEANLLPGKISLDTFKTDPSTCLPLKHMFELAQITEIGKTITAEQARPNGLRNLLRRVSEITTKHIHDVWKEYKTVKVLLAENGQHIDAGIEDKFNVYNFSRRSDGFKRFITFLLMISVKQRTNQLSDTLLLIDEPDIGLHPSGARYLRDELIEISRNNYVVYSTHSIFMIDRENIGRHLLVKKTNEVTSATEADHSNIKDEEVIYNALGYSIFESLEKKNIVFEGWRDKQLFRVAIKGTPAKHKALKAKFDKVGVCHVKGVKDVTRITPILELAGREVLVVSDNDMAAIEHQKKYDGPGKWLKYADIEAKVNVITSEDFIKPSAFTKALKEVSDTHPGLPSIKEEELAVDKDRLKVLSNWLAAGGVNGEEQKRILNQIKEDVFNNLKVAQVEERYFELLEKLAEML